MISLVGILLDRRGFVPSQHLTTEQQWLVDTRGVHDCCVVSTGYHVGV